MKSIRFLVLMILTSILLSSTVTAAPVTKTVTGQLTGGVLSVTVPDLVFDSIEYSFAGNMTTQKDILLILHDERARGDGWELSVGLTNFTATLPDRTNSVNGSTMNVELPASIMKLSVWSVYNNTGQAVSTDHGPKGTISPETTLGTTGQVVVKANPGFGMGEYTGHFNYKLTFPDTVKVASLSAAGTSGLSVGDDIPIIATSYTTTFTYDLSVGI